METVQNSAARLDEKGFAVGFGNATQRLVEGQERLVIDEGRDLEEARLKWHPEEVDVFVSASSQQERDFPLLHEVGIEHGLADQEQHGVAAVELLANFIKPLLAHLNVEIAPEVEVTGAGGGRECGAKGF